MRRREFLLGAAVAAFSSPLAAQSRSPRKIGYVSWFAAGTPSQAEQFRKGMNELGYNEGRDFTLEAYFTDGDAARTREIVQKLVQQKIDILVAVATPAIAIAKKEAGPLPNVMASVADPIAAGLVQSLARRGGNLTGRTMFGPDLAAKRLSLLREIKPSLRKIAFLGSSAAATTAQFVRETKDGADSSGLSLIVRIVEGPKNLDSNLFEELHGEGAEAVFVHPIFTTYENSVLSMANAAEIPVVADYVQFAKAGAILTYGIDLNANIRRAAYFVDRIFKGAAPADLPIEQPNETKLAINLIAAKRFGWTVPNSIIVRADELIE